MTKKINLEINSCSECPYYGYNNEVDEKKCNLLDKLLFYSDTHINDKEVVFKDCPLENSCECKCIYVQKLGKSYKVFECDNCKKNK